MEGRDGGEDSRDKPADPLGRGSLPGVTGAGERAAPWRACTGDMTLGEEGRGTERDMDADAAGTTLDEERDMDADAGGMTLEADMTTAGGMTLDEDAIVPDVRT